MDNGAIYTQTTHNAPNRVSLRSLGRLFSRLKATHVPTVYPLNPVTPPDSEFFNIDDSRRIRVLRFKSATGENEEAISIAAETEQCSWTEDYWFTRWTRPLKKHSIIRTETAIAEQLSGCGCSFRRRQSGRGSQQPQSDTECCERYIGELVKRCITEVLREVGTQQQRLHPVRSVECCTLTDATEGSVASASASRRVVLLYHGIGSGADDWRAVGVALAGHGYHVLAADMLGHGYSSTPDRAHLYTFDSLLADALRLYDHYTTDTDQCILIGHSYGCSLVTAMARLRPLRTTQLVLIAGGGPTPLCPPGGTSIPHHHHQQQQHYHVVRLLRAALVVPLLFCGVRRQLIYPPRGKHHRPCPMYPVAAVPAHVLRYVASGQNWPQGDAALHRRILVPTLLVHGTLDDHVTLVQQCEMERTIPRAFLELLPDTGHMAMLENPQHLTHMILCFMDWWQR